MTKAHHQKYQDESTGTIIQGMPYSYITLHLNMINAVERLPHKK